MKIAIIGGGTAGWFVAGWLGKFFKHDISLVESADIKKIGVGESVTPHVQRYFDLLEIDTHDLILKTAATYKFANKFSNWTKNNNSKYFGFNNINITEEFVSLQLAIENMFKPEATPRQTDILLKLFNQKKIVNWDNYFFEHYSYMENNTSPFKDGQYQCSPFYTQSLHINAELTADYVRDNVAIPNGINHIISNVVNVNSNNNNITSVELSNGENLKADLFIDCTGFKGILVNKLGFEKINYEHNLIDSAWVCQLDYDNQQEDLLVNYTESIAQPHGWMFKIGLYHRLGSGYCFSSKHISKEDALSEFQGIIKNPRVTPRLLTWTPGRLKDSAAGNVISIGLSSGFVEPLEANALFIITASIKHLDKVLKEYESTNNLNFIEFNQKIACMIDDIADFIRVHYTLSDRDDTDFWKDCKNIRSQELEAQLVKNKYFDPTSSILNSMEYNKLFPNHMWLNLAIGWGLDTSSWELDINDELLAQGFNFFQVKSARHRETSQICENNFTWLKNHIFKMTAVEWEKQRFLE